MRCGGAVAGHVDLPVQAGLSSSSALVVAWIQALARVAGVALAPHELAAMAHRVEVLHFGEPGGHMDHVASAVGGTLRIHPDGSTTAMNVLEDGVWVVVDSGQPKDTRGHLTRCKTQRQRLVSAQGGVWRAPTALPTWAGLSEAEQRLWQATWQSKALEERASGQWSSSQKLAGWMTDHHAALRDGLELSTPASKPSDARPWTQERGAGNWWARVAGGVPWFGVNAAKQVRFIVRSDRPVQRRLGLWGHPKAPNANHGTNPKCQPSCWPQGVPRA